jgi:hypothetical protein
MPLKLSAFLVVRDRSYRFAGESCVGRSITWCPITTMIARIRGGGKNANGASNGRMLAASTQLPPATRPATTPSPLPIHTTSAPRSAMGASQIARLSRSRPVRLCSSRTRRLNSCPGDSSRCLARAPAGEGYCARPVELDCHFESDLRIVHLLRHPHPSSHPSSTANASHASGAAEAPPPDAIPRRRQSRPNSKRASASGSSASRMRRLKNG